MTTPASHTSSARRAATRVGHLAALLALSLFVSPSGASQSTAATGARLVGGRQVWDTYFPFRLGDSWTYDWRTNGPMAPGGVAVRTRTFDGTSFLDDRVGYKLVSDDGAYHLYTYDDGVLSIHSSSEAGRLMYYDPAVVLAAPSMIPGQPIRVPHGDTGRVWTTTLMGLEDVTVPLGRIGRCLAIALEMTGPDFSSRATHYFAPRLGLVAYKYELRDTTTGRPLLDVDAGLKLARLSGHNVTTLADAERLPERGAPAAGEDQNVREVLRRALMKRYTWDAQFPGFRGEWELIEQGGAPVAGTFEVGADFAVRVEAPNDAARATMRNEISSFVTQRKAVPFDVAYAETSFARSATRPGGTTVIIAVGDPLATTYTVKGDEVIEVSRSMGRVSYTARDRRKIATEDGRTITTEYDVIYTSNQNQSQIAVERTADTYEKVGSYWVPTGRRTERTAAGAAPTTREVRFKNVR